MENNYSLNTYKFADIAENIVERKMPKIGEEETYIGLEHIDSGSLHITRWGSKTELKGQKFKMKKGDVLFGRRNAYLRRAAIAPFDGIFSAHGMVLRPRENVVCKEFFPFFVISNQFMERAIQISVGSLSPTVNWGNLKQEEFTLPPLDEQRRIAKLLWAADDVVSNYNDSIYKALLLKKAVFESYLKANQNNVNSIIWSSIPTGWSLKKLNEVSDVAYGISEAVSANTDPSIGWPILTGANITLDSSLDLTKLVYIKPPKINRFLLQKGDILFNWRSGSKEHVGKTAIFNLNGNWTHASFILRIRVFEDIVTNTFLNYLLGYMKEKGMFGGATTRQINFKLNASTLRNLDVIIPPKDIQEEIVRKMAIIEDLIYSLQRSKERVTECRVGLTERR
jgi:type I restriction enzyme, S subunit